jgi:hypothetical protein
LTVKLWLLAIGFLALTLSFPGTAHAQRGRYGPAMSAYGPVYNPTMSPEYQLWARNPEAYEQLMMQRQMQMEYRQQQAMLKQQQQFEKWLKEQKAKKDKGQPTDPAYDQIVKMQEQQEKAAKEAATPRPRRKRTSAKGASPKTAAKASADPKAKKPPAAEAKTQGTGKRK